MGNVQTLKPKKEKYNFQVTEEFLHEFQKHVLLLDNAVLAIAKAVDTMSLLSEKCLEKDIKGGNMAEKLEAKVRKTMSDSISGNKAVLVACVQDFFKFIAEEGSNYIEYAGDLLCFLKVRAYDQDRTSQDENNDFVISFLKGTFSSMKDEITTLSVELAVQEKENNNLLKRIEILQAIADENEKNMEQKTHPVGKKQEEATKSRHEDEDASKEILQDLDQTVKSNEAMEKPEENGYKENIQRDKTVSNKCKGGSKVMEMQHNVTKSSLSDEHEEYSELRKLGSRKTSIKTLESQREPRLEIKGEKRNDDHAPSTQVLTYRQSVAVRLQPVGHFNAEAAKQNMLAAIQDIFTNEHVYVEVLGEDQRLEVDMPLLIIFQHHRKPYDLRSKHEDYVMKPIEDRNAGSSSAVIVFHDTEENQLEDSKQEVMASLISVGSIFHIAQGTSSFKENVAGIVKFIKENGTFAERQETFM